MKLDGFDSKIVQIGQEFAEIEPFWYRNGHLKWTSRFEYASQNPDFGGSKNTIFLKIGSRIHESAKNDLEIPYKYIPEYL